MTTPTIHHILTKEELESIKMHIDDFMYKPVEKSYSILFDKVKEGKINKTQFKHLVTFLFE